MRGDEPSPTRSAVLIRLSHGHIRIGTFQRLAFFGETENIAKLVRYCLEQLYGEAPADDDRPMPCACSTWSARRTATLAASYLAAGFVHGVLNSDNINVTGESFDYGPWRFTPEWDAASPRPISTITASTRSAASPRRSTGTWRSSPAAWRWSPRRRRWPRCWRAGPSASKRRWSSAMLSRLGVAPVGGDEDRELVAALIAALRDARGGDRPLLLRLARRPRPARRPIRPSRSARSPPRSRVANARSTHPYWSRCGPCSMQIDEVEAIWSAIAERDDWHRSTTRLQPIRRMGDAMRARCTAA